MQPSGARARIGESRAGDLLGEMSMLDGGTRFCACTALTPVTLAVLASRAKAGFMRSRPGRWLERVTGAVLIGLGLRVALESR